MHRVALGCHAAPAEHPVKRAGAVAELRLFWPPLCALSMINRAGSEGVARNWPGWRHRPPARAAQSSGTLQSRGRCPTVRGPEQCAGIQGPADLPVQPPSICLCVPAGEDLSSSLLCINAARHKLHAPAGASLSVVSLIRTMQMLVPLAQGADVSPQGNARWPTSHSSAAAPASAPA